jgi:telomerase protein component 1
MTSVDGDVCHQAMVRRKAAVLTVGQLDMFDKAEVVRQTLAVHRKVLDESSFNNQVIRITVICAL